MVLVLLILTGTVLVVGSYTFLPALMEREFGREIKVSLGLENAPEVSLNSEPAPNILVGKFESGRVMLEGVDFEGIRAARVSIDLDPFDLRVLRSLSGGALESEEPLSGKVRMELSGKEVARLANAERGGPTVESVRLEPGRMTVGVETTFMGVAVPVSVAGGLDLEGGALVFRPRGISAFGVPLPESLSDRLVSQAGFEYPLEDLPYDLDVSDVRVEKERVVVQGRIGRIPVGKAGG